MCRFWDIGHGCLNGMISLQPPVVLGLIFSFMVEPIYAGTLLMVYLITLLLQDHYRQLMLILALVIVYYILLFKEEKTKQRISFLCLTASTI